MVHAVVKPSETHEAPCRWLTTIFGSAILLQRRVNGISRRWCYSPNSSFVIKGPDTSVAPNILSPDGALVDEVHRLLVVVEVARSQTMAQVLLKVEENWAKEPNIRAVIVIKMEETPGYRGPPKSKVPVEPILSQTEWLRREWPLDDKMTYDSHSWYGRLYSRFIIFIRRTEGCLDETASSVRSSFKLVV